MQACSGSTRIRSSGTLGAIWWRDLAARSLAALQLAEEISAIQATAKVTNTALACGCAAQVVERASLAAPGHPVDFVKLIVGLGVPLLELAWAGASELEFLLAPEAMTRVRETELCPFRKERRARRRAKLRASSAAPGHQVNCVQKYFFGRNSSIDHFVHFSFMCGCF